MESLNAQDLLGHLTQFLHEINTPFDVLLALAIVAGLWTIIHCVRKPAKKQRIHQDVV